MCALLVALGHFSLIKNILSNFRKMMMPSYMLLCFRSLLCFSRVWMCLAQSFFPFFFFNFVMKPVDNIFYNCAMFWRPIKPQNNTFNGTVVWVSVASSQVWEQWEDSAITLSIDNTQFNSTRDIGINMIHIDHINSCILQFSTFSKRYHKKYLEDFDLLLNQEATREVNRSRIELTRIL
jgi:hypothetical protein